jgi:hypothetical protein
MPGAKRGSSINGSLIHKNFHIRVHCADLRLDDDVDRQTQCPPSHITPIRHELEKAPSLCLFALKRYLSVRCKVNLSLSSKYSMMHLSNAFVTLALTWLAAITHAADLSYNGLAITPQMGWVRTKWLATALSLSIHSLTNLVGFRTIGTPLVVTSTRDSSCHLQRRLWIGAFEILDTTTLSWTTAGQRIADQMVQLCRI